MLERLRLHVATDRFLAERRGDWAWEAACDYAALALAAARVTPGGPGARRADLSRGNGDTQAHASKQPWQPPAGRVEMKPRVAFDVCHEVYVAAREIVNSRLPTMQHETASRFLWRPDLRPHLVEYVADFALAGARALGDDKPSVAAGVSRALAAKWRPQRRSRELHASRLVLFRLYYLGGAEYQAARRLLGLSELTWSAWTEEIRARVGRELLRSGIFPPSRYFREMTEQR
jgi:hypothetical protein